jgi:hypothetical protein
MSQVCVKLKKPNSGLQVLNFNSFEERSEWLRSSGFYETGGIYRRLDGSTAGLFSRNYDQMNLVKTCDKPIQNGSMWRFLCR